MGNKTLKTIGIIALVGSGLLLIASLLKKKPIAKTARTTEPENSSMTGKHNLNESVQFKKLYPNLLVVSSTSKEILGRIFVRMQGCVDSKEFRNKIFSHKEYENWFSKDGKNVYTAFVGYNIPSYIIKSFTNGDFKNISPEEYWLLNEIKKANTLEPYYVIGYLEGSETTTLKHELAHALYYLSPEYKKQVDVIVGNFLDNIEPRKLSALTDYFKGLKYHNSIYDDEVNAYLVANKKFLISIDFWDAQIERASDLLNRLFQEEYRKFFGKSLKAVIG